jgi:hypothetical protein
VYHPISYPLFCSRFLQDFTPAAINQVAGHGEAKFMMMFAGGIFPSSDFAGFEACELFTKFSNSLREALQRRKVEQSARDREVSASPISFLYFMLNSPFLGSSYRGGCPQPSFWYILVVFHWCEER